MITAPSFGFIVKGETHLTATQVNGDKTGYTVTFKSRVNGKIINVINTDASGNFEMPTAPSVPYYTFESYSNGVAAGASATVTKDTVITVNYKAAETDNITIDVYYSANDFENGENIDTYTEVTKTELSKTNYELKLDTETINNIKITNADTLITFTGNVTTTSESKNMSIVVTLYGDNDTKLTEEKYEFNDTNKLEENKEFKVEFTLNDTLNLDSIKAYSISIEK